MSHHFNYSAIGWETFEDLCINLWFDEGFRDIKPYGRTREGGRDAVFQDKDTDSLVIFQFKRWTSSYPSSTTIKYIKEAAEKVSGWSPDRFILNSSLPPNGACVMIKKLV